MLFLFPFQIFKMSVLVQASLRNISPQRFAPTTYQGQYVCMKDEEKIHYQQHQNASTFVRRFLSSSKEDADPNSSSDTLTSDSEKKARMSLKMNFAAFGAAVPLRIAEMNKYVTEASKWIMSSGASKTNGTNTSKIYLENQSSDSNENTLEQSLTQMNQSIASFYDTSCATNEATPYIVKAKTFVDMEEDDDLIMRGLPKTIGPLFPKPRVKNPELKRKRAAARREQKISRLSLESRTKSLVLSLKTAHSLMSKITRAEELCEHLILHPECVWDASAVSTYFHGDLPSYSFYSNLLTPSTSLHCQYLVLFG